jgi:mannose/cellobiose epimerase-like protein (N-acyl-D-glucosamine 2-epimerase family)
VYTLDWHDKPVERERMHWVTAEAIGAAAVLGRRTGDGRYADWYGKFWAFADAHFIDRRDGGWRHELDATNRPSSTVWSGKPDTYHAYQATLIPRLPIAPSIAGAVMKATAGR